MSEMPSQYGRDVEARILEGIVTTRDSSGHTNVAPMGPIVDPRMESLLLRPFQSSQTYRNLKQCGRGVFHITDDVELIARAAIDRLEAPPTLIRLPHLDVVVLEACCRWYAFEVTRIDDQQPRTRIDCRILEAGRRRDFLGFNRAKHAVLEATIAVTRIGIIPDPEIEEELRRCRLIVDKTAGPQERRALEILSDFVEQQPRHSSSQCDASM